MKRTLQVVILGALLTLTACMGGGKHNYRPSDDPLVLARFEQLLNEQGIAYRRDIEGFYRPLQRARYGDMVKQGKRALEIGRGRESLRVTSGCALGRLLEFLDDNGYLYVRLREGDEFYLQMAESDFADGEIARRYSTYQSECAEDRATEDKP